ncbi:neuropeptide FF receptor 2-like [Saccoglossus kowalevskii]|uniref:Probable G-protein coupled receptor 83-like n=1 Tax=Saccoglossus kowalevskii TaxID=10224 RepID=A0ABM0GKV8_SACKO|nr:PREDICTED: probable G-protein coupled receptor 83-like [Saccoglossus kowalevskii]
MENVTDFPGENEIDESASNVTGGGLGFDMAMFFLQNRLAVPDGYEMFLYSLYFVLIIGGNIWVIIAVIRQPKLRKSATNLFIISLSTADLLMGLFDIPWRFLFEWAGRYFVYLNNNIYVCWTFAWFQWISRCATVNSLVGIAIDRYRAIVQPMKPRITRKQGGIIVAIIWILAIGYGLRKSIIIDMYEYTIQITNVTRTFCMVPLHYHYLKPYFQVMDAIVMYILPLIIIVALYSVMISSLWFSKGPSNASNRNKKKAVKMLTLVVFLFALSWLPYYIYQLYFTFYLTPSLDLIYYMELWWHISHNMYVCNSFVNPFLYAYFNENFRKEFFKMFPCLKAIMQRKVAPVTSTNSMKTKSQYGNSTATAVSTVSQGTV